MLQWGLLGVTVLLITVTLISHAQGNIWKPYECVSDPIFPFCVQDVQIDCHNIFNGTDTDFCDDALGAGGSGVSLWIDNGSYLIPNASYASNIYVPGYVNADDWSNVSIYESQILDLSHTVDTDTWNTTEEMQDATGAMAGAHLTYNDAGNDLSVDDDWWNAYSDFMGTTTSSKLCRWDGSEIDCDYTDIDTDTNASTACSTNTEFLTGVNTCNDTSGWDVDGSDDFDGAWGSLTGVPAGFADNVDNDTYYNQSLNTTDNVTFERIESGRDGIAGNITIRSTGSYSSMLLPATSMTENTFYRLPPSVDELAQGTPVISWSSISGDYINLYWTSIPAPVSYLIFNNIDVPSGTNPVADQSSDILYLTSDNNTIEITGNSITDTVDFSVNTTTDYTWNGKHTFIHENTTIPHAISEPSRALATEYQNNGERPLMAYGSVLFSSNQYCQAYTGASSPPTTRQQIFGPAAAAGFFEFNFFFVVPASHYYNITCVGGGTLYEWLEVVL